MDGLDSRRHRRPVDVVADHSVTHAFPGWVGKSKQVGPDGLRAMLAERNEAFTDYDVELSETLEAGERVVAWIDPAGASATGSGEH